MRFDEKHLHTHGPARAAFLIALTLIVALLAPSAARGADGDRLPDVPLVRLDGSPMSIADWTGKPLVLNIWATWCPPCRTEMPSLQRLSELIESDGMRVAALSLDNDRNLVREFVLKYGIGIPVGIATNPGTATGALDAVALPLTLYVATDGRVVGRHFGQREWDEEKVVEELKAKLLAPPPTR